MGCQDLEKESSPTPGFQGLFLLPLISSRKRKALLEAIAECYPPRITAFIIFIRVVVTACKLQAHLLVFPHRKRSLEPYLRIQPLLPEQLWWLYVVRLLLRVISWSQEVLECRVWKVIQIKDSIYTTMGKSLSMIR